MTFLATTLENGRYIATERHGFDVSQRASTSGMRARVDKVQQK
jgi:hypothetical protein